MQSLIKSNSSHILLSEKAAFIQYDHLKSLSKKQIKNIRQEDISGLFGVGVIFVFLLLLGFVTSYGHLKRFASGIKKGKRVKQKEVIGYVGQTGVATGPHLDYRCQKDGRYVNPLRMIVPSVKPLEKELLDDFRMHAQELLFCMNFLCEERVLASAE